MIFTPSNLQGAFILDIKKIEDDRGFFARSFCRKEMEEHGLNTNMVQANCSFNKTKGTLRGLHMQNPPFEESKLVRCTRGAIFDVIVDLRKDSQTFKQWLGVKLSASNHRMLYIPEGCAHGYITLEDATEVYYHVTEFYTSSAEVGFRWDDPAFNIQWPIQPLNISQKDINHLAYEF